MLWLAVFCCSSLKFSGRNEASRLVVITRDFGYCAHLKRASIFKTVKRTQAKRAELMMYMQNVGGPPVPPPVSTGGPPRTQHLASITRES